MEFYFCVPRCKRIHFKVENIIKSNTAIVFFFFFASLKGLAGERCNCRAFHDTSGKEELIHLMLTMHKFVCFILTRAILTNPLEKEKNI